MATLRAHTRREILSAAAAGAACIVAGPAVRRLGAASASAQAAAATAGVQRLAEDLFLLRAAGEANVVAHTTGRGVVLVDGGSAKGSDALLKAVAALPGGGPVQTLFNTHWHPEQTGSNERLGTAGAAIVAHENTRLWLTTDVTWPWSGRRFARLPKIAQPNKTFYTTGTIEPGDKERREGVAVDNVRYGYIPDAAHTDGDLYVFFPGPNVLAVGDAVCGEGWPVVDWATGGWIGGIVGGLRRVIALANEGTRVVPARGPVLGLAELKAQQEMYATIYDRLTQLLNRGRSPGEAVEARPTKEFDAQMGNPDEFVRRAFESLWAYISPDA